MFAETQNFVGLAAHIDGTLDIDALSDTVANIATALTNWGMTPPALTDITATGTATTAQAQTILNATHSGTTAIAAVSGTATDVAALTFTAHESVSAVTVTGTALAAQATTIAAKVTAGQFGAATYSISDVATAVAGAGPAALNGAVNITVTGAAADAAQATTILGATNSGTTSIAAVTDTAGLVSGLVLGANENIITITATGTATVAQAERIKTLHGSAIASANEDREMIEAPPRGDDPGAGPVIAPRSLLKGIIAPRVEETLELLRERLKEAGALIEPGAGIVLTGGASQLAGVREVAVRVFDRPVRLGRPRRVPHLADAVTGPAFCAAAGVLHRAAFGPREAVSAKVLAGAGKRREPVDPGAGAVTKVAAWLRDNL